MPTKSYDITVRQAGDHYEAIVAELAETVTAATADEALTEAQKAIATALMEAQLRKKKRGPGRSKGQTVA